MKTCCAHAQVFDGHGGVTAAEFASRHLLDFTLAAAAFPSHPSDALVRNSSLSHMLRAAAAAVDHQKRVLSVTINAVLCS